MRGSLAKNSFQFSRLLSKTFGFAMPFVSSSELVALVVMIASVTKVLNPCLALNSRSCLRFSIFSPFSQSRWRPHEDSIAQRLSRELVEGG